MPYICTSCNYQTMNKTCYLQHLQRHEENLNSENPPKTFFIAKHTCLLCDYRTDKKKLLKAHEILHSNIKKWQCNQCNYNSFRESNLTRHTKSIHENLRYFCDLCPYNTTRTNYLKEHVKFVH